MSLMQEPYQNLLTLEGVILHLALNLFLIIMNIDVIYVMGGSI